MGKWKWIPWTLKKPGNVWQTSTSFRYSYDLFNVFPRHYFIYLFIYSYILRTQSAVVDVWRFPFVAERCKWNLLTFALLWVLWRPRPVCVCSLLDVHKETHLLTVILVDNSYWSLPSLCRWKYQWVTVIAAKWNAFPWCCWRRRERSNCHSRLDWTLRSVEMMIHYIYVWGGEAARTIGVGLRTCGAP